MSTKSKYQFNGTQGPWKWVLNKKCHQIQICGGVPRYDKIVMDFKRYGMGNGAPRFNHELGTDFNVMERADLFASVVTGREHHADWFQSIDHPDAHLIAAAPELLQACVESLSFITEMHSQGMIPDKVFYYRREQLQSAIQKALNIKD